MRLANSGQTDSNSGPPSLASVFLYSARRSSSVQSRRAKPTIAHSEGRLPPRARWNSAGMSLRWARSPVAPKRTMAHGSDTRVRGSAWRSGLDSIGVFSSGIAHPFGPVRGGRIAWCQARQHDSQRSPALEILRIKALSDQEDTALAGSNRPQLPAPRYGDRWMTANSLSRRCSAHGAQALGHGLGVGGQFHGLGAADHTCLVELQQMLLELLHAALAAAQVAAQVGPAVFHDAARGV